MNAFTYEMGQKVTLKESDGTGTVIGQAHHLDAEDSFNIRYKAADGRQVECWWSESALTSA